jgi:hypothetical protein
MINTAWSVEHGDKYGIILLNDFVLGDLFSGPRRHGGAMTHLLLWPDVVVDLWIWPSLGTHYEKDGFAWTAYTREELLALGYTPAGWQTPKHGDGAESGSTEKQQAGWPSLGREAQRVLTSASSRS